MKEWKTDKRFICGEEDIFTINENQLSKSSSLIWLIQINSEIILKVECQEENKLIDFKGKVIGFDSQGRMMYIETSPNSMIWIDPYTMNYKITKNE